MCLAAAAVAIGLILIAAHAQSGDLDLHAPFPFTVENATLAARENEAREPGHLMRESRDQQDQAAVFDHVESTHSRPADAEVTVSVYNDAQVPPDILARAEQQTAKIFSRSHAHQLSACDQIAECPYRYKCGGKSRRTEKKLDLSTRTDVGHNFAQASQQ
jgi:hypothetical protein